MIVGRVLNGELRTLDKLRERVRIAEGLDRNKSLSKAARERGLACLRRFRERLAHLPDSSVRAVGTNTFRLAQDARRFVLEAEEALGRPIDIVSGQEEARLIYLGVSHHVPSEPARRLVIDIGGGSTECILGEGFDVIRAESLSMGCVGYSSRFFSSGSSRRSDFDEAVVAARLKLSDLESWIEPGGWDVCIGASGTVHAIKNIIVESGWSSEVITYEALRKLRKALLQFESPLEAELPGLRVDRKPVLPGGLAILMAFFQSLKLDSMRVSSGALREGVLYDLFGRIHQEDVRERTVRSFMQRYQVDAKKARRVEKTALMFFDQVAASWKLDRPEFRRMLSWASRLLEIGLTISHSGFHKHSEFLVANSDMAGFSNNEQAIVSALVRAHRGKIPREVFEDLHIKSKHALRLCALLRLSVLLNRSQRGRELPPLELHQEGNRLTLTAPEDWWQERALTRADLTKEASLLESWGMELVPA